jgi:hypothetical protein
MHTKPCKRYWGPISRSQKEKFAMAKHSDHGIVLDDKSQEQPKDKERAQTVTKTKPGHMPPQPITKEDNKRPPK